MNYYYDILLNFQDTYYMFYEWDKDDNIEFIKKIPLFHIEEDDYLNLLNNKIKIDNNILKKMENKTKLKNNNILKYAAIFSDGKNSLAIEFDKYGNSITKSSLLLEDELNIHEFIYSIDLININYSILNKEIINNNLRQDEKVKKVLKIEINNIYKKKEYSKLKFYYLEWFNELNDDIDSIYKRMIDKLNKPLSTKEYYIYKLIKTLYNV